MFTLAHFGRHGVSCAGTFGLFSLEQELGALGRLCFLGILHSGETHD
jgi:hypothetical protein